MLDVVPPGLAPVSMRPTARGSERSKIEANMKAIRGMNRYCELNPMPTALGFWAAALKSATGWMKGGGMGELIDMHMSGKSG